MSTLRDWITQDKRRYEEGQHIVVELDQHSVAIKGNNVFPVTYSLIANVSPFK